MNDTVRKNIIYALTLEERKQAFTENGTSINDDPTLIDSIWLEKRTLCSGKIFDEMLNLKNISKEEFAFLIKRYNEFEKKLLLDFVKKQSWYKIYIKMKNRFIECNRNINNLYLTEIFNVYIEESISRIKFKNILFSKGVINGIIYNICLQVNRLTWKVLVTEMDKIDKSQYSTFIQFLKENYGSIDDIEEMYFSYPVLLRLLVQKTLDLTGSVCEMLLNIDNNFYDIEKTLKIGNNTIKEINFGLGDTHDEGKTVTKIIFGNGKKFFYKPKNLYIEQAYYYLVSKLNLWLNDDIFYINNVYYDDEFTIEQAIENRECKDAKQIENYYYRTGAMLALMSILQGTDFHSENIIACESFPVIADFETFFSHIEYNRCGIELSNNDFIESLISTAMLPTQAFTNNSKNKGIEVGGISGGKAEELPTTRLVAKNIFTLDMEFEDKILRKKEDENIPILNKKKQDYQDYINDLIGGFNKILSFVSTHKVIIKNNIKDAFANLKVREVLKPTVIYYDLIQYVDHPSYLTNMVDLERLFSNSYSYPYNDKKIVNYEIKSFFHIEIPLFYTITSEKNLYFNGEEVIKNLFEHSAIQTVISNILQLDSKIISKGINFLKLRLMNGKIGESNRPKKEYLAKRKENISREKVEMILSILIHDLADAAIYSKNHEFVTWKSIGEDPNQMTYGNMDESLYSARSGVLLILDEFLKHYSDKRIYELRNILKVSIINNYFPINTSLFSDTNGIIYSMLRSQAEIESLYLRKFLWSIENIKIGKNDFLSGISSYIPVLQSMKKKFNESDLHYDILGRIGDIIKQNLWKEKNELKGFGHGYMGILYVLCLLENNYTYQYSHDIDMIINLMKQDFCKIEGLNSSWCNGFSGVGLAAIKSLSYLDESILRKFIDKCLFMSKHHNLLEDASICHGLGSEIEFLIECKRQLGIDTQKLVDDKVFALLNLYEKFNQLYLYETSFCRNWGLFTGRCGIIYILLKYLYPNTASVLTLEVDEQERIVNESFSN